MGQKASFVLKKLASSDNEFSKRFTVSIRNFMFGHVAISLIACITLSILCLDTFGIIEILNAMMPVYIAQQGANYVKSGYENGKKIASSINTEDADG